MCANNPHIAIYMCAEVVQTARDVQLINLVRDFWTFLSDVSFIAIKIFYGPLHRGKIREEALYVLDVGIKSTEKVNLRVSIYCTCVTHKYYA